MNDVLTVALFIGCIFLSSCSQIMLKKSASKQFVGIKSYLNPFVIIAYIIFLAITLCSTLLYSNLSLSLGTALDSLGYVFVTILSVLILKEKISKRKFGGMLLIIGGVIIFSI